VLQPLHTTHNKVLCALKFSNFKCRTPALYKQLSFLKIKDIYHLVLSKLKHKFHNNTLPQSCNSFFQKITETHSHFIRSAGKSKLLYP